MKIKDMILPAFVVATGFFSYSVVDNEKIKKQEARYQEMSIIATQMNSGLSSPIEQVNIQESGIQVPESNLPQDAIPTSGYKPQIGSEPKKIIYKTKAVIPNPYVLIVERTAKKVLLTQDPIWTVSLVDSDGKQINKLEALSGRSYKQYANRHQSGNKSPLPDGIYSIDLEGIAKGPFDDPELGKGYWIPITPLFRTARSALGFHQDPSWGKMNGESGTSGCIGLDSPDSTMKLVEWIRDYKVRKVIVATSKINSLKP